MQKEELYKRIGLKIRELRKSKHLTIQELSDKIDIEYNNLIRIEKGRTNPTISTLYKIASELDVTLKEVVDIND
ncbi:MAG: helix-turn-helix domain-containing protein [Bacteroidales bacterium]|nr:helix-turn-helix domain-containing protein [Bacteroidales bacterium]